MYPILLAFAVLAGAPNFVRSTSTASPPSWSPQQATGAPDVPKAGDDRRAWATQVADGGVEWLELTYRKPVKVRLVRIFETLAPGAVSKVVGFGGDEEVILWQGTALAKEAINVLEVTPEVSLFTNRVRIYIDTSRVTGWNEIDAVELIGADGSRQWASGATASVFYGQSDVTPPTGLNALRGKRLSVRMGSGHLVGGKVTGITDRFLTLETDGRKTLVRVDAIDTITVQ